ncbi:hypothetical protein Pint_30791 [Pistacia integerrima]|uniref:Uncharacterized protein n=1 Tax=Pistacia integerrima TaxID=434235 RepID=A0ACC0WYT8_9ROSI|nr:hypothetical protein Pint_30791 [Pistacia integerrima]
MCGSQLKNMVAEELRLLLKGHRFHGEQAHMIPNRSGSSPPSLEGLGKFKGDLGHFESEEHLCSDPAFFASLSTLKEELEDDRSPRQASNNWAENNPACMSGQKTAVVGWHKRGVYMTIEHKTISLGHFVRGFPRTTSPVYNQSPSSSYSMTDEPTDHDVHAVTLDVSAISLSEEETRRAAVSWENYAATVSVCTVRHPISGSGSNCITRNESYPKWHENTPMVMLSSLLSRYNHRCIPLPSGVYAPHYNVGGYALNFAFLLLFVAGYPPHGPVPMPFDATSEVLWTPCNDAATFFVNPFQMQYFEHPFGDAYSASKEPPSAAYLGDQKLLSPPNGSLGIPNPRKLGISIVGGTSHPGRQNDLRYPQGSYRNTGIYPGWQGQRGVQIFDDPKRHSFLEELKSSNAQKFELWDIVGRIVDFRQCSSLSFRSWSTALLKTRCLFSKIPHASKLMTDVFGNYVIEKNSDLLQFFKRGSPGQREELADKLVGQMLPLSLRMYGCRVIQKHILEGGKSNERSQIISKVAGKIVQLSQHKYASNVVEKCLEYGDAAERELLIEEIIGQSEENDNLLIMMKDQFANYVVQKILEKCSDKQWVALINRIKVHCQALKKYTYGKHIVAWFEQLYGEESQASETSDG